MNISGYPLDAMAYNTNALYNATFDIYRATTTRTDAGGTSQTWAVVESGTGRTRELGDSEQLVNDERKVKMTHKLYCDPAIDIQRGDVVVITNAPTGGTETLLVIDALLPDNVSHHYEVLAKSFEVGSNETPTGFDILGL